MPRVRFESTVPVLERAKTFHILGRTDIYVRKHALVGRTVAAGPEVPIARTENLNIIEFISEILCVVLYYLM
jgi:hypothetical protein